MRIELSPWETAELSIPSRRRRRKPGPPTVAADSISNGGLLHHQRSSSSKSAALSLVPSSLQITPSRSAKKAQKIPGILSVSRDKIVPTAVVTVEDCVTVVGTSKSPTHTPRKTAKNKSSSSSSLGESRMLQYECQPGSCFFSHDKETCVPVVLNAKHGRFFGLQNNNQRLVSWDATSSSSPHEGLSHLFEDAVVSLELMELEGELNAGGRTVVYGSLRNGKVFVVITQEREEGGPLLNVQLLDVSNNFPDNCDHVATVLALHVPAKEADDLSPHSPMPTKRQQQQHRKRSFQSGSVFGKKKKEEPYCVVYQTYIEDKKWLVVVKRKLTALRSLQWKETEVKYQRSDLMASLGFPTKEGHLVQSYKFLGWERSSENLLSSFLIGLRIGRETVVVSLSMDNGPLFRSNYRVTCDPHLMTLVSETVVAAHVGTGMLFLDAHRGALLDRCPLPQYGNPPTPLALHSRDSNVLLLSESSDGVLFMAKMTVASVPGSGLADALLASQTKEPVRPEFLLCDSLSSSQYDSSLKHAGLVQHALSLLDEACAFMESSSIVSDLISESYFTEKVNEAARDILGLENDITKVEPQDTSAPQDKDSIQEKSSEASDENLYPISHENPQESDQSSAITNGKKVRFSFNGLHNDVAGHLNNGKSNGTKLLKGILSPELKRDPPASPDHTQPTTTTKPTPPPSTKTPHPKTQNGTSEQAVAKQTKPTQPQPDFAKLPASFLNEVAFMAANLMMSRTSFGADVSCVLKAMVRTRKVNARTFLRNEKGSKSFLVSLCTAMDEFQTTQSSPSYSSTELMFDMLKHCRDVSESEMADILRYQLLSAPPSGVARFLKHHRELRMKRNVMKDCKRYLFLSGKDIKTEEQEAEVKSLTCRITVLGLLSLLKAVLGCSSVNMSLLRRRFEEIFSRDELALLLQALPRFLQTFETSSRLSSRLFCIVGTLHDCMVGYAPLTDKEDACVKALRNRVNQEVSATQAMVPIRMVWLYGLPAGKDEEAKQRKRKAVSKKEEEEIHGYQIERLLLEPRKKRRKRLVAKPNDSTAKPKTAKNT